MAVTTGTTDTTMATGTIFGVTGARVDRSEHRAASRDLRDNAGIDLREHVEAVADFGAAARRLRESVRGGDDAPRQRCFSPAAVRAAAAAAAAPVPVDAIEVVQVVEVDAADEGRKRESVALRYLRNRRAAKA